ncbi:hypothetical protein PVIIG_06202 [Plasmodium vivax India VII]|uniref:Variable surface protein n=1 Tax=Plasmodium vivax India VII TaxID=1077284 RepID=A0A0J9SIK9_PLAVI|nr:hypothetical protein PVIIG_06202 [Plasmodium vivax India VII]
MHGEYFNKEIYNNKVLTFYKKLIQKYYEYKRDDEYSNYVPKFDQEIFKKYKCLVDLHDNLGKLLTNKHCKYATSFVDLYNDIFNTCYGDIYSGLCTEIENLRKDYETIIKTSECSDAQKTLPSIYGNNNLVIIIMPLVIISLVSFLLLMVYKVNKTFNTKKYILCYRLIKYFQSFILSNNFFI